MLVNCPVNKEPSCLYMIVFYSVIHNSESTEWKAQYVLFTHPEILRNILRNCTRPLYHSVIYNSEILEYFPSKSWIRACWNHGIVNQLRTILCFFYRKSGSNFSPLCTNLVATSDAVAEFPRPNKQNNWEKAKIQRSETQKHSWAEWLFCDSRKFLLGKFSL